MAKTKEFIITTTAEAFLAALRSSYREKKTSIPILNYVLVDGTNVIGTDLDNTTIIPFAGKGKGTFTVPIKQAEKLLAGEKGPLAIRFVPTDKKEPKSEGLVHLEFGECTFDLPTLSSKKWPVSPGLALTSVMVNGKAFKQVIDRTRFAISKKNSRYTLNGALLLAEGGKLRLITTDGHRLAIVFLPYSGEFKCLIPRDTLDWIYANMGESFEIGRDATVPCHLTVKTGGKTIVFRELLGEFPNWKAIRREKYKYTVTISDPKRVHAVLTKVAKCADERSGAVKLSAQGQTLTLSANSTEMGKAKAYVACQIEPALEDKFEIGVNSQFVLDFLKQIGTEDFHLSFEDNQSAMSFHLNRDEYEYIVMPMRL